MKKLAPILFFLVGVLGIIYGDKIIGVVLVMSSLVLYKLS